MTEKTRSKLRVTKKMMEARKAVDKFTALYKYPPSYRQVAKILTLSSANTAYQRLRGYRHKMVKQQSNKSKK